MKTIDCKIFKSIDRLDLFEELKHQQSVPPKCRKQCLNKGHCRKLISRTVKVELQELTKRNRNVGGSATVSTNEARRGKYWYIGNVTILVHRKRGQFLRKETRPVSLSASHPSQSTLRNCKIMKKSTTTEPQQPKNRLSVSDKKTE